MAKKLLLYTIAIVISLSLITPQIAYAADDKEPMSQGVIDELRSDNNIRFNEDRASASCSLDEGDVDFSDVGGDVAKDLSFGKGEERPANIAKKLMADFNFKDFQAAGIVGNFMVEAGVNVWPDINEGGHRGPPKFSGGYGFAQWTASRQKTFINFAVKHGFMSSKSVNATDAANYAYLKYEMTQTAEKAVTPAIRASTSVSDAVLTWERVYERAGKPALGMRLKYAKQALSRMHGGSGSADDTEGVDGEAEDCSGSTEISKGAVFDSVTFPLGISAKQDIKNREMFKDGTSERGGHPYIAFDILVNAGTKVVAMTDGVVTRLHSRTSLAEGISIYNSDKKLHVYYTHMIRNKSIKEGDKIKPGDELGTIVSVKKFPAVNADHLHIDAGKTKARNGCSRNNPNGPACNNRVDIGPDLYNAFQKVGGSNNSTKSPKAV